MKPVLTVVIPAHNPNLERLGQALLGLRAQTLECAQWETLLVDNASTQFPKETWLRQNAPQNTRVLIEPLLGLSAARRCGLREAAGDIAVLVDDDNVLQANYLENAVKIFTADPRIGLAGGRSLPSFESAPPDWANEFFPLLALRDLGAAAIVSNGLRPRGAIRNSYPAYAPIGAGMALRRGAWESWLAAPIGGITDRRGGELSSSGDNDIVLSAMRADWEVGYFPDLELLHVIPPARLEPRYLARLNLDIQKSWMRVLTLHDANPWPPLGKTGAALRKVKAWFAYRAWSSPAARIRWCGACGHFEGRTTPR
jgi:glycosyltransferase involved in cell wall biosynthesis